MIDSQTNRRGGQNELNNGSEEWIVYVVNSGNSIVVFVVVGERREIKYQYGTKVIKQILVRARGVLASSLAS